MRQQDMKLVSASSMSDPVILQLIASLALAIVLSAAIFTSVMKNLTAGTLTVVFFLNDCLNASFKIVSTVSVWYCGVPYVI